MGHGRAGGGGGHVAGSVGSGVEGEESGREDRRQGVSGEGLQREKGRIDEESDRAYEH